ncbi:U-box domain-containing protein 19-like [Impatiens glandulifera]|uniref:U-box domain-containing protein 19-like n=1 Tax=Impatiens glandulifera TaxID=253017 RepID=UPI001FB16182|nr:U-box domain-containing protein 19-like [Impatiens glandulifera]
MIREFDRSDRRFLTFPAVHPCESISPAILLNSLISSSRKLIKFNSKLFSSQKRKVRETLRQITILSIFFDEISAGAGAGNDSITLCLSELHHAFQKVQFLLDDCSLEGARLWILMKSHFVSTQFRVLIRSISTALEVLPMGSIGLSREVIEIVELVGKQGRKAKMEMDREDEVVMNRVILILNQFENRFEPDISFIKSVLDYLKIRTWKDCQSEIKFLERLIGSELECEVTLLSSLIGFMSYCRGIVFETGEYGENGIEERGQIELPNFLNTEDFVCPISLEVMTDPVVISTGQTYDRTSIGKWLKAGNLICPKTGEKLVTTELVPNSSLKKLIHQFCFDNGISIAKSRNRNRDITRTILPGSPSSAMAIEFLAEFLVDRLCFGTDDQRKKAAYEIRLLAKTNIFNRSVLINAGAVFPLLHLLGSSNPIAQENSAAALLKLSKHAGGRKPIIENNGLEPITEILKHGLKSETKQISAAIVFYLASVKEYRKSIGGSPELISSLFELVRGGTFCMKKNSLAAIFALILHPTNRGKVLEIGALPILFDLITSSHPDEIKTEALAILSILAETSEGSVTIFEGSCLSRLIDTLNGQTTSRSAKEYCVSTIVSLCKNLGNEVIGSISKNSVLMASLYSMLAEGTVNGGKKARTLIKILHKFCEMD